MAQVLSPGAVPERTMAEPAPEPAWHEDLNVRLICPECREDPPDLFENHSSGDLICASCGLVLQQRTIDQSSEWRTFSNDDSGNDDPSRVGDAMNMLLNGDQLNTGIAFGDGGMRTRDLQRVQNKANLDKGNKALLQAYKQIGALCDGWQLPGSVSDTAKHLFKDAEESKLFRGKSVDALIAGCVFLACRRNGVPRTFREVTALTKVSKKEIGRTFKSLENYLLKKDKTENRIGVGGVVIPGDEYKPVGTAEASELCTRFCNQLGMDHRATKMAIDLATKTSNKGFLAGRSPLSTAAACIYAAGHMAGQAKTTKEIMGIAGVSDSTIRQAYKKICEHIDELSKELEAKPEDIAKLPKPA